VVVLRSIDKRPTMLKLDLKFPKPRRGTDEERQDHWTPVKLNI
jgi:hypothetical protein